VAVRAVRVVGNTALPEAILEEVVRPFVGREIDYEDLQALRDALTAAYVARGYATSGAVIPEQSLADGELEVWIVEGRVAEIEVRNDGRLRESFERVTGGRESLIHGLLRSEVGDADLFLLNPSGIPFGSGSRLDLGGSFYASTAHALDFEGLGQTESFEARVGGPCRRSRSRRPRRSDSWLPRSARSRLNTRCCRSRRGGPSRSSVETSGSTLPGSRRRMASSRSSPSAPEAARRWMRGAWGRVSSAATSRRAAQSLSRTDRSPTPTGPRAGSSRRARGS
jgi:filamentous hemagglutinin family protein